MKKNIDIHLNSLWCIFVLAFLFVQGILNLRPFLVAGFHIFLRGSNYEQEESMIAQSIRGRFLYIDIVLPKMNLDYFAKANKVVHACQDFQ